MTHIFIHFLETFPNLNHNHYFPNHQTSLRLVIGLWGLFAFCSRKDGKSPQCCCVNKFLTVEAMHVHTHILNKGLQARAISVAL